jgi:PEP-CTERM motif
MKFSIRPIAAALALAGVAGLASTPAQALTAFGVTYTLTETSIDATHEQFTLDITGINGATDTEGGRSGVNALAFTQPANFVSATLTSPAGWTYVPGGLNSTGCDNTGNFFCFDNPAIPPTPGSPLPADSSLQFVFTVTTSAAGSFPYTPDLKIDWVGSQTNYDLVSLPITPTPAIPEPGTYAMLMAGLGAIGFMARRRRAE